MRGLGLGLWGTSTKLPALQPVNTVPPSFTGTAEVGETLAIDLGTWINADTVLGRIERSPNGINNWSTATSYSAVTTYDVTMADRRFYLRLRVVATNENGSEYFNACCLGPVPLLDADATTYTEAVEVADDAIIEPAIAQAYDDFIIGLKADSVWSNLTACCIMVGARTLPGCLVPLRGPAPTNVNFVSADYNRKTGLKGNGVNKYLDSNQANQDIAQNDFHMSVKISELITPHINRNFLGISENGTGATHLRCNSSGNSGFRVRHSQFRSIGGMEAGMYGASRSASEGYTIRRGGTDYAITEASQIPYAGDIWIFARNDLANTQPCEERMSWYSLGNAIDLEDLEDRLGALVSAIDGAIP